VSLSDEANALKRDDKSAKAWAEITPEGGEICTGELPTQLAGDWSGILLSFGLDPAVFEVVDDTVRMSKWQSSKRLENGDRDLIWLYSYRARFRRRNAEFLLADEVNEIRKSIGKWKAPAKKTKPSEEPPCTFVVCWADQQLGKSAGGGTMATVSRIQNSYAATVKRINDLRNSGRNIEKIAIVNMGDPVEGCDGNYASQLFTVELTQRQQLLLALDLWVVGMKALVPHAKQLEFISVLCNHGEWMRRNGKSVTSDSDNVGGFLAETLQRVLSASPEFDHTEWKVPHDEMITTSVLSDVKVAFTHGHKISGKEIEWLRGQSIKILREELREPDIWVTAHKHHLNVTDFGPWTRFQCPSNDGGSKWYTDMSGNWSTPGTLTFCVGKHDDRNWSDMAVL